MAIQRLTDKSALAATPADDDLLMIIDVSDTTGSPEGTSKKITVANLGAGSSGTGTVTSVAVSTPSAFTVAGSPITTSGTIAITGAGAGTDYVDGTGSLQAFPAIPSGTVTDVTGVSPIGSTGGATPAISITNATTSLSGAMSATDKTKLNGIDTGAQVNAVDDVNGGTGLTASPSTGSVIVSLDDTAVTAAAYTNANITVDAQGRITLAASGSSGTGTVTSVALTTPSAFVVGGSPVTTNGTLDITGAGTTSQFIDGTGSLQTTSTGTVTGVTGSAPIVSSGGVAPAISITASTTSAPGSMSALDKTKLDGIATGAEVNTVDDVTGGTGLTASPTTGNVVVNLDTTAVVAGTYTNADITVDAQGRLTNATNGASGTGTVTSVGMTVPSAFSIAGSPITTNGTLALTVAGAATEYIDGLGALQTLPQATVTGVTGTAPISVTGVTAKTVSITAVTPTVAGSMSAADKVILNTIAGSFASDDVGGAKNVAFESIGGISASAGVIVSIMQDTTADNTNANSKDFLGVVTSTSNTCIINGMVEITGAAPNGATAGRPLYLGTLGTFISAPPTTPNNAYARVMGHYIGQLSAGSYGVFFNPSNDWVQIS